MTTLLSPAEIISALQLRDLSNPAEGPHAMHMLLTGAIDAFTSRWGCTVEVQRPSPVVAIEDNYDRLGYAPSAITRDSRYSRYLSDTVMLRSHTSAGIPPALRALATSPNPTPEDLLLVLPGLVYRRDVIDRLHVGTPHQVDIWRIVHRQRMLQTDLADMIGTLVDAVLPGARWRIEPAEHPYTEHGHQVDVHTAEGWVELAECGLAAPHVLARAGLDPDQWSGLALGMGLDRALMLRKHIPDIRLLRAADSRISEQMLDLTLWRTVSMMPPVRRDLSIVTDSSVDAELLGDQARCALGGDADILESLAIRASTYHEDLPPRAQARLGTRPGQVNMLICISLRPIDHTLIDHEANTIRDRVYAALHRGPVSEWATEHPPLTLMP